jgi:putative endonuclease
MRWLTQIWRPLSLGERGERLAARYLSNQGYDIVARNFRLGDDEADLLAIDATGTLVIVEVKTRRDDSIVAEASVGAAKRHRLSRIAARLQRKAEYRGKPIRFDVVAVVWPDRGSPSIRHSIAAFDATL